MDRKRDQKIKIEPIELPIEKLVPAVWNYKRDNHRLTRKLINNIKRNGQLETICVRELPNGYYEVINGNHRLDAFRYLGYKRVFAFNLGKISETQAKRIAIELNETKFESDGVMLSQILSDIVNEFSLRDVVETIPFDAEAMAQFQLLLQPEQYVNKAVEKKSNQDKPVPFKVDNKITIVRVDDEFENLMKQAAEKINIPYERGTESFFLVKCLEYYFDLIKARERYEKQSEQDGYDATSAATATAADAEERTRKG